MGPVMVYHTLRSAGPLERLAVHSVGSWATKTLSIASLHTMNINPILRAPTALMLCALRWQSLIRHSNCKAKPKTQRLTSSNWYDQRQRYHVPKSERITWEDWYRGTHKWIKAVYKEVSLTSVD